MTVQDLKDNRQIIIDKMNQLGVHESMRSQFMRSMVEFVENDMPLSDDFEDFVYELFHINSLRNKEWRGHTLTNGELRREVISTGIERDREEKEQKGLIWNPVSRDFDNI